MKKLGFVSLALALSACGGKVIFSEAGSGGTGAGTTSSKSSGKTVGATSNNGQSVGTTNGSVAVSTGTGAAGTCADFGFNGIGASCGNEGQACVVPNACCGGSAVCKNGVWVFLGPLCQQPCLTCNAEGFACDLDAVCVIDQLGFTQDTYQCFPNPCPAQTLDCSCAQPVCGQNFLTCQGTMQSTVVCDCPNCGG